MGEQNFDVVVIGAGPAEVLAEARRVPGAGEAVRGDIAVAAAVPMPLPLEAVAPFPTRSEIWLKLLERYEAEREAGALAPAA